MKRTPPDFDREEEEYDLPSDAGRPRNREVKICGQHAVEAVVRSRIEDVVRVVLTEERIKEFGGLLKWCAQNRKAYHVVDAEEIARVAESVHHEGICLLVRQRPPLALEALLERFDDPQDPAGLLYLKNIQNPHNLGAILRVAAHFGIQAVLLSSKEPIGGFSTAVHRTAMGGAEAVELVSLRLAETERAFDTLRTQGFTIYATSGRVERGLYDQVLEHRSVFAMGAEGEGLGRRTVELADAVVRIPGSGAVESLNVAAASAAVLGEYWRTVHAQSSASAIHARPGIDRPRRLAVQGENTNLPVRGDKGGRSRPRSGRRPRNS